MTLEKPYSRRRKYLDREWVTFRGLKWCAQLVVIESLDDPNVYRVHVIEGFQDSNATFLSRGKTVYHGLSVLDAVKAVQKYTQVTEIPKWIADLCAKEGLHAKKNGARSRRVQQTT